MRLPVLFIVVLVSQEGRLAHKTRNTAVKLIGALHFLVQETEARAVRVSLG